MIRDLLNPVELETLRLSCWGWTNTQIAELHGVQPERIRKRFAEMYKKTDTADKLELATSFTWEELEYAINNQHRAEQKRDVQLPLLSRKNKQRKNRRPSLLLHCRYRMYRAHW